MLSRLILVSFINYLCNAEAIKQNFYSVTHPCVNDCIQWTSEQQSDSSAVSIYCHTLIPCLKNCTKQLDMLAPIESEYASFYEPICEKIKDLTYLENCLKSLDVSHCAQKCNTTEADFSVHLDWRNQTNFDARLCSLNCLHPSYESHCGPGTTMNIFNFYKVVFETQKKRFNLPDSLNAEFERIKNELPENVKNPSSKDEKKGSAVVFCLFSPIVFFLSLYQM